MKVDVFNPGAMFEGIGQMVSGAKNLGSAASRFDLGGMLGGIMECMSGMSKATPGLSMQPPPCPFSMLPPPSMSPPALSVLTQDFAAQARPPMDGADCAAGCNDAPQNPIEMLMQQLLSMFMPGAR